MVCCGFEGGIVGGKGTAFDLMAGTLRGSLRYEPIGLGVVSFCGTSHGLYLGWPLHDSYSTSYRIQREVLLL